MFYVYLWLRDNGTPYYVGKGTRYRAVRKGSPNPAFIIIQVYESETEAFEAEKFLIAYYGRKDLKTGVLRNLTDGGEGCSGAIRSAETRRLISEAMKGKSRAPHSPEAIERMAQAHRGMKWSLQARQNLSKSRIGAVQSPEHIAKRVEKIRALPKKTHCPYGHLREPASGRLYCRVCTVSNTNKRRIEARMKQIARNMEPKC